MLDSKNHGFRVLSKMTEYKNPFMIVNRLEVERPNGKVSSYWVLERGTDFSIIIPLFFGNETLLVGQYRVATSYYSWEFPMGSVKGEKPDATAKIELREETGYTASNWQKIGDFNVANGHSSQSAHVYIADNLTKGDAKPEENEFLEIKKVPIDEVKRMINAGKIKDGPTIVAYHLYETHLEKI